MMKIAHLSRRAMAPAATFFARQAVTQPGNGDDLPQVLGAHGLPVRVAALGVQPLTGSPHFVVALARPIVLPARRLEYLAYAWRVVGHYATARGCSTRSAMTLNGARSAASAD